jgi:hypothetical protein
MAQGARLTARATAAIQVCLLMELYEGSLADKLDAAGGALPLALALGYGERGAGAARGHSGPPPAGHLHFKNIARVRRDGAR